MSVTPKPVTLATLPERTAQEVFDWIVFNLRKQGKKSKRDVNDPESEACAYRSEDGCRCAAGWLIDDAEYKPDMEGWDWRGILIKFPHVSQAHKALISSLQCVHDAEDSYGWEIGFQRVARAYELVYTYTPPENA